MFCANCGNQIVAGAMFCGKCGTPAPTGAQSPAQSTGPTPPAATFAQPTQSQPVFGQPVFVVKPPKSFLTTWLLSFFLGAFGVDRFYLGQVALGIAKLLATCFGFIVVVGWMIWPIVDLVLILSGKMRDSEGRSLEGYEQYKKMALWVTVGVYGGSLLLLFVFFVVLASAFAGLLSMAGTY